MIYYLCLLCIEDFFYFILFYFKCIVNFLHTIYSSIDIGDCYCLTYLNFGIIHASRLLSCAIGNVDMKNLMGTSWANFSCRLGHEAHSACSQPTLVWMREPKRYTAWSRNSLLYNISFLLLP